MNTNSDSLLFNVYNNLSDGNWGNCCTTNTLLFTETDLPANFNVFNNVCVQNNGDTSGCFGYYATTGVFANNTAIGITVTGNVKAIEVGGTNITFENNVVQNYGQFIVVDTGTTFTSFDYNYWGPNNFNGNNPWEYGATGAGSFAAWQSACSCDSHGGQANNISVNSVGVPLFGSPLITAGINLTSLAITGLNSSTTAGGTIAAIARPASTAWDIGAYNFIPGNKTSKGIGASMGVGASGAVN